MCFKSKFLNILQKKGLIYQCSSFEGLDDILSSGKKVSAYIGFDCTAPSLHVGSLIQILLLRTFQLCGHTPIVLLGGGTTLIGDPSGKDESRRMLTIEQIKTNEEGIKKIFSKFIKFDGDNPALLLNNADWLTKFTYVDFLRTYGTEFTINRMLHFDSVKLRLERESPLTFLEFNYMLLQAVDFLYLNSHHNTYLQMGGSDQWGNIINGVELIRRMNKTEAFALTSPLLTKSDGTKMGKTASGAVWLDEKMFSPWDFYQYFRNVDDDDTIKFLKLFTDLPDKELEELSNLKGQDINQAKKILAFEITKLCHGLEEAKKCSELAINTFEKGTLDKNLPTFYINSEELTSGILLTYILKKVNFATSVSDARRSIEGNAIKINDNSINDVNFKLTQQNMINNSIKISFGKKRHILLSINNN